MERMDAVVVLDQGRTAHGTHAELLAQNVRYAAWCAADALKQKAQGSGSRLG
jgi:ABC-type multidrug transport system fused ATPase/permease subunit